jgi:hypothetical protein
MSNTEFRAQRCAVIDSEPLVGERHYDYADSFRVKLTQSDSRSPEELFRSGLQHAGWVRMLVPVVHRYVLGFRLGPQSSPTHIVGWRIIESKPDVVALEAVSPLAQGMIVGRNVGGDSIFSTYLFYARPSAARLVWAVVSPLHRAVAPYLMNMANSAPQQVRSRVAGANLNGSNRVDNYTWHGCIRKCDRDCHECRPA